VANHTQEQFQKIVDILNMQWKGIMSFQLVGSLSQKPASYNDADIVVYPAPGLPRGIEIEGFAKACQKSRARIVEVDRDSKTPFPGRPEGQDRIRIRFTTGQEVDLFFPKGKK
jgi:hypothetical protein